MIAADLGITAYADRYLIGRSVSRDYATRVRSSVEAFCKWVGTDVPVHALTADLANEWIGHLQELGKTPWTVGGYRGVLFSVWNEAYRAGHCLEPPFRVRPVKRPRQIVEAYTHDEIGRLLAAAANLDGRHSDDRSAADFWRAALHVGYCCGARRGDLLDLRWKHTTPDGRVAFIQHKTGFPITGQLSAEALRLCRHLDDPVRLLPWPYNADWFSRAFKQLRKSAGLMRGSFKWVRRSAGSYAERECRGDGAALLGHRDPTVFRRFYDDQSISGSRPPAPPPLPGRAE